MSTAPQVTRTGQVLVVQGDPRRSSGRPHITRYYLHEKGGAVTELAIDRATARQFGGWLNINGKRLQVTGARLSAKKLAVRSLRFLASSSSGTRTPQTSAPSGSGRTLSATGTVRYATLLCRYADNAATPQP